VLSRVRHHIQFEANISYYEANKTGFLRLFRVEANHRILHAKQIKMEANIPSYANILLFSLQGEYFEARLSEYFKKNR
jgi:hypothetical protein